MHKHREVHDILFQVLQKKTSNENLQKLIENFYSNTNAKKRRNRIYRGKGGCVRKKTM